MSVLVFEEGVVRRARIKKSSRNVVWGSGNLTLGCFKCKKNKVLNKWTCRDVKVVTQRVPDGIPLTSASGANSLACLQTPEPSLRYFTHTVTDGWGEFNYWFASDAIFTSTQPGPLVLLSGWVVPAEPRDGGQGSLVKSNLKVNSCISYQTILLVFAEHFYVKIERVITPLNLITGYVNNCSQALPMTDAESHEAVAEFQPTRSDFYLTHVKGWRSNCSSKVTTNKQLLRTLTQGLPRRTCSSVSGRRPNAGPKHTRVQGQGQGHDGWVFFFRIFCTLCFHRLSLSNNKMIKYAKKKKNRRLSNWK